MTGVYVFSQAKNATEGAQEANFAISRLKALGIGPKDLQLPVYMDYEFDLAASQFAPDVDLWVAQYYKRNQSPVSYTKWQYSSSARINGMLSYTGLQGNIDVNFWYLNKKVNPKAIGVIKGRRTLSLADARSPKFKIYNGNTRLRAGVDYTIGGIRNNRKGKTE